MILAHRVILTMKNQRYDKYSQFYSDLLKTQAENSEKKESTQKVEEDDDLEKIEEKMDTSSPWPDATGETAPVTTTFNGNSSSIEKKLP